ncbi:MAG: hypothetical protein MJ172_08120 [Clostridia bacterium]|nr:hypothetical protein [Clostridia bacterium]
MNSFIRFLDAASPNYKIENGFGTVMAIVLSISVVSGLFIYKVVKESKKEGTTSNEDEVEV